MRKKSNMKYNFIFSATSNPSILTCFTLDISNFMSVCKWLCLYGRVYLAAKPVKIAFSLSIREQQ